MPEKPFRKRNCHDCGLEAIDNCKTQKRHIPDDEELLPCSCCVRNPLPHKKTLWRADFYDEQWTRLADRTPIIEDVMTPHQKDLLQTLHLILSETTLQSAVGGEKHGI